MFRVGFAENDLDAAPPDQEVVAQQIYAITQLTFPMVCANVFNALAFVVALWIQNDLTVPHFAWALVVMTLAMWLMGRDLLKRKRPFPKTMALHTRAKVVRNAVLLGAIWAYPGLFVLPDANGLTQAFVISLASGMVAGGAITLYPIPKAAFAFCFVVAGAHFCGLALAKEAVFIPFMMLAITFLYIVAHSVMRHYEVFAAEFQHRHALARKTALIETLLDDTRRTASNEKREAEVKLVQAQKMESIGTLTSGVAHDFNNLLAVIMGNIELARMDVPENERDDLLLAALGATERGAELTRRLLAFSRKANLVPTHEDLNDVLQGMEALFRRTLPAAIAIETRYCERPCFARVDRIQLENALLNLVLNARDAMHGRGTITLTVTATAKVNVKNPVEIMADAVAQITVQDNGDGIPLEIQDQVFDPFFSTKPVGQGSGLGLAMIYGFVSQSGGAVDLSSQQGTGTQVTLSFPMAQAKQVSKEKRVQPHPDTTPHGNARALVVEDDDAVRRVLVRQLKLLDYKVHEAPDGDQALAQLRDAPDYDLVITDFSMPGFLQGSSLARVILNEFPATAVIIVSGYPDTSHEELDTMSALVPCLNKPIQQSDLRAAIAAARARRDGRGEAARVAALEDG